MKEAKSENCVTELPARSNASPGTCQPKVYPFSFCDGQVLSHNRAGQPENKKLIGIDFHFDRSDEQHIGHSATHRAANPVDADGVFKFVLIAYSCRCKAWYRVTAIKDSLDRLSDKHLIWKIKLAD